MTTSPSDLSIFVRADPRTTSLISRHLTGRYLCHAVDVRARILSAIGTLFGPLLEYRDEFRPQDALGGLSIRQFGDHLIALIEAWSPDYSAKREKVHLQLNREAGSTPIFLNPWSPDQINALTGEGKMIAVFQDETMLDMQADDGFYFSSFDPNEIDELARRIGLPERKLEINELRSPLRNPGAVPAPGSSGNP